MSSELANAVYRDICRNIERQASAIDVLMNLVWGRGVQAALLRANSVVTTSIPPSSIATGAPARIVGQATRA